MTLPPASSPRVLLAEDDDEMRRLLVRALSRDGYEVIAAANGVSMLAMVDDERHDAPSYDLVITDLRMPGIGGMEVLDAIRRRGWTVPMIIVTGFASDDTHERAAHLGATIVFQKPFDVDDLRAAVGTLLRG